MNGLDVPLEVALGVAVGDVPLEVVLEATAFSLTSLRVVEALVATMESAFLLFSAAELA